MSLQRIPSTASQRIRPALFALAIAGLWTPGAFAAKPAMPGDTASPPAAMRCSPPTTSQAPRATGGTPAASRGTPTLERTVVIGDLRHPWDIAFAPDGTMLFTQREAGLFARMRDGRVHKVFVPDDLLATGQSGMSGIALDPGFATNRTLYVYFGSRRGPRPDNRIARLVVSPDFTQVSQRTDILSGVTFKDVPAPGAPASRGAHNGGRIAFGPDGYLWVTTGDTHHPAVPQSGSELGGKVLRIDCNGKAAPDNGTPSGTDPRIYARGFRNVQGIAFRPRGANAGTPYICEHGPGHSDEVTPLRAGGNGGWDPVCPDGKSYCGYSRTPPMPMTDTKKFPQALAPAWSTGGYEGAPGRSWGMAGCGFVTGPQWRDWDGALMVTLLSGQQVAVLQFNDDGTRATRTQLPEVPDTRYRTAIQGPDGALYLATDNGSDDAIVRVAPK